MRYIYYIVGIVLVLSAVIGYELLPGDNQGKEAALRINGRTITAGEFKMLYASCPPYARGKEDFTNSLITKELLIQEAHREGIDKDERFRNSIQNFYEQSLIKLLMDRKFASLQVAVSDDEVDRYMRLMNSKVSLTIFTADASVKEPNGSLRVSGHRTALFEDLSGDIRDKLAGLREGQTSDAVKAGNRLIAIRLDRVTDSAFQAPAEYRETVRRQLAEAKKEKAVNDWISDLRKGASVTIFSGAQKGRQ